MVQGIRHIRLTPLDRPRRLHAQIKVNVHVVIVRCSIHRDLVLPKPLHVVERLPRFLCEELADGLELLELGVAVEHEGVDHLAGEVDGLGGVTDGGLVLERRLVGEQALGRPVGGRALGVAGFVEEGVDDVGVPVLGVFDVEDGGAGDVAEEGEVVVGAEDEFMDAVEAP